MTARLRRVGECGDCRHWQWQDRDEARCGKHWRITLLLGLGRKGYRADCHEYEPQETQP